MLFLIAQLSRAENTGINTDSDNGLGIGIALVRFDTSFKFTDNETGQSIFIDTDGTLGLPDVDTLPVIYGSYRLSKKHAIGFNYFKVKRESALFDFDKTLDDVHITGQAFFKDETSFFNLKYVNTIHDDDYNRIQLLFGLNILDIKYVLEAEGTITYIDNHTVETLYEEASAFAPLPLIGLDFLNSFTSNWKLNTKISLVAGNYQDIRAWIVHTNINVIYQINKNVGATLGIAYFDADITINNTAERDDIKYGYDGAVFGLHIIF